MGRSLLVVTSVLAVLIVGAIAYGDLRSPERVTLDATARAGAPVIGPWVRMTFHEPGCPRAG
jgi:hypothetical protein